MAMHKFGCCGSKQSRLALVCMASTRHLNCALQHHSRPTQCVCHETSQKCCSALQRMCTQGLCPRQIYKTKARPRPAQPLKRLRENAQEPIFHCSSPSACHDHQPTHGIIQVPSASSPRAWLITKPNYKPHYKLPLLQAQSFPDHGTMCGPHDLGQALQGSNTATFLAQRCIHNVPQLQV